VRKATSYQLNYLAKEREEARKCAGRRVEMNYENSRSALFRTTGGFTAI
jgi:hypothetical protein